MQAHRAGWSVALCHEGGRRDILEGCGVPSPLHQSRPMGVATDAGEAATGVLQHLVHHLVVPCLASLDAEEFFVLTLTRPTVRRTAEGPREVQWPQSEFFVWQPPMDSLACSSFAGWSPT